VRAVFGGDRGARLVIVRPPAVYGPGDRASLPLIVQLTRRRALLPGGPRHRFSLLYVDDLARALVHLATMADPPAGRFGIHDGRAGGYGWADLARCVGEVEGRAPSVTFLPRATLLPIAAVASLASRSFGRIPRLTPGKVREFYHPDWVCRSNLFDRLELGFEPVRFTEGLSLTLDWYRRQGWLPGRPAGSRTAASANQGEPAQ
jgi:nucleoside-diphosphate-sugar epimerase